MTNETIMEQDELFDDELLDTETEQDTSILSPPKANNGLENFTALSQTSASDVVKALQNKEVMAVVTTDEQIKTKVREEAKNIIHTELDTETQKRNVENAQAHLERNKYACSVYGVEENCPIWQQKLMKAGAGFWFCIYWVIATLTIAPIVIFAGKLATILRKNWIGWLLAVLFYVIIVVLIVGTPILIEHLQSLNVAS